MRANRDTEPPTLANYLERAVMRRSGLLGVSLHWALLLGVSLLLGATVGGRVWGFWVGGSRRGSGERFYTASPGKGGRY